MNIGGGKGGNEGDLPIFICALRTDSVAWKSGQIKASTVGVAVRGRVCEGRG